MRRPLIILIVIIILILIFGIIGPAILWKNVKLCSSDTHVCEDGSTLSRDPNNNCDFPACPEISPTPKICTQEAKLCPDGSYVSRDSNNNCEFSPCPETNAVPFLPYEQARALMNKSICTQKGALLDNHFFNENSRTWWTDLKPKTPKTGCNPACILWENKTVEINWRCTGFSNN